MGCWSREALAPFFLIMGNEPYWALLGRLSRGGMVIGLAEPTKPF